MFKKLTKIFTLVLINGLSILLICSLANSADFPKKAIKIMVSAGAGGGEDTEARGIAPFLGKQLGVGTSIENQGAAGGKVLFERFQKTEPDGYTLITYTAPKTVLLEVTEKVNFKSKDYTPICAWSWSNQVLVVNAETWKTFDEFLKAAKTKTMVGGLSGGHGTLGGLSAADELGLKVNWVPFEGAAESLTALAGKHIEFLITVTTTAIPLVKAGKLRALVLLSDKRDPYLPDVPTSKELGVKVTPIPGVRGLEAPPNTPPEIAKILENACLKAVKDPGFIDFAKKRQMELHVLDSKGYGKVIADFYPIVEKYRPMLRR